MLGAFERFGNSAKQVIGGFLMGLVLLPLGVVMQKCAADQMPYDKYFKKTVQVSSSKDIKKESTPIWTEGSYRLTDGSPYRVSTYEGDRFSGEYIQYKVVKRIVIEKKRDKKDKEGRVIGTEYTYSWEDDGTVAESSPNLTVEVNGFRVKFSDFSKKYIERTANSFKYNYNGSRVGEESDRSLQTPTEKDYRDGIYLKELRGYLYNGNDSSMLLAGLSSPNSDSMGPITYKSQEMLVLSYSGYDDTLQSLKDDALAESLVKFIAGTICFMLGFTGIFGPLIKLLDFIPILGDLAIGIIYIICAVVSLLLSILFFIFFKFFWILVALAILIPLGLFAYGKFARR